MDEGTFPTLPSYSELSTSPTNERCSWGLFSANDELGTVNLLTPTVVKRAANLVRHGKVFNLSLPLNLPNPPVLAGRGPVTQRVTLTGRSWREDILDNLSTHASSHLDGLGHLRYREFGFFGGRQVAEVDKGALGIDRWADHGIVGRGVLVDIARQMERCGSPIPAAESTVITPRMMEDTVLAQGISFEVGDILLLRTGWMSHYLSLDGPGREAFANRLRGGLVSPGLEGSREMAAWLWDRHIAIVAADNLAVECAPGDPAVGSLHQWLLPLLGMPMGELWNFEALAADCAKDGVYECMLVSVPLNVPGGMGSPANAIAIR